MKRLISLLLVLTLSGALVLCVHAEEVVIARPAFDGYLIERSVQRMEDTFAHLEEFYIRQYPEEALRVYTADEEDRAAMQILSDLITEDCDTDREKAEEIHDWMARNITYDVNASAYPNDTFYRRTGNCLSYALLMQTLLRMAGVPAAVGTGWRGNMETCTVDLFSMEGHAWCFAYVDEQWVLYDPLWLEDGTADREYMAKWIWFDNVEFVTPVSDSANLPPVAWDSTKDYYTDGIPYTYSDYNGSNGCCHTLFVNNLSFGFVSCQTENGVYDGWHYLEGESDVRPMRVGQCLADGWVSYGDYRKNDHLSLAYAFPNGMMVDGAVMEFEGQPYMMSTNQCFPIEADPKDYSIREGRISFHTGYTGPFLGYPWAEEMMTQEREILVENWNPEIAVINGDGTITCLSEGFAEFSLTLKDKGQDGHWASCVMQVVVSDEVRVADYSDRIPGEDTPPAKPDPGITGDGVIWPSEPEEDVTEPEEPEKEPEPDVPSVSFEDVEPGAYYELPVSWAVANGITNGTGAGEFSPSVDCNRAQVVTFLWRSAGKPQPASSDIPFTDVLPGAYYTDAVLWAVEQGITQGMGDGSFGTEKSCTRAQVATFLWRAAGEPAAKSQSHSFADIKKDYYYDAVLWAVEQGITNGTSATTFEPGTICSRAQIVTFLYRYMK